MEISPMKISFGLKYTALLVILLILFVLIVNFSSYVVYLCSVHLKQRSISIASFNGQFSLHLPLNLRFPNSSISLLMNEVGVNIEN